MPPDESVARARLLESHRETLRSVVDAGRSITAGWAGTEVQDSSAIRGPLEDAMAVDTLDLDVLRMLQVGADAFDATIQGEPIPAPPYLVVTSRGPVCRATLSTDRRLVIAIELFAVDRNDQTYRFLDPDPEDCLAVSLR